MDDNDHYLESPRVIVNPGGEYGPSTRRFQGIPSIACDQNDVLRAVWYGGVTPWEDKNNYVIMAASADGGETWTDEQLIIEPTHEDVRAFDPEIWRAPNGRIWLFWAQGYEHDKVTSSRSGVWVITADESGGRNAKWSAPRRLCDGVMMCKPIVLSTGEWALPASLWHKRDAGSASIMVSQDRGNTWTQRGACDVPPDIREHDEHMVVELQDQSILMLVRTKDGISKSISADGGRNWSPLKSSGIPHPVTRFFIRRLHSGRLLLVRHDPEDGGFADGHSRGTRSHLKAYLSDDDGQSWVGGLLLDKREGVSYPDGAQAEDGTIYVIYDYDRTGAREILMARFREKDIRAKTMREDDSAIRILINKATA